MLTEQDLIAIEEIFDKKLDQKLDQKLDEKFKKELKPIKSELKKIRRDLNAVIKHFDDEVWHHGKRITRIESHLQLPEYVPE